MKTNVHMIKNKKYDINASIIDSSIFFFPILVYLYFSL